MTINPELSIYTIYFFDHTGTRIILLDDYEYMEYTQRLNDSWNHIIRMNMSPEDDRLVFFRATDSAEAGLVRDYIIEVYRIDPVLGTTELVYEGFNRTLVDQVKQDGSVVLTLYGTGYTHLLKRRIIIPPAEQESSVKTGVAETVIKDFVTDQAISPTDATRIIDGLANETDAGAGGTAEYSARYTNLFTAVSRCAEQGSVDFGITKDTTVGTFLLQVRELWGTDRRVGNSTGIAPTIFDVTLNNMIIPISSTSGDGEVNHVYVGGQGQGVDRTVAEYSDATAEAISPWNRHEAFVDARSESTADGLETRGTAYLEAHKVVTTLSFNIQQTLGTRWLRNWELGDIVTARYASKTFTKKIVEVSVVVSAGETGSSMIEVISAELEETT